MHVAHVCNYAPGLSGMYGTVRELLLAERAAGMTAEIVDDAGATQLYGMDGIQPVGTAYGDTADIICWHHAMFEPWLNEPHRNLVLFLHGTPEHNLYTELGGQEDVLSLIIGAANMNIPRAFISMWKRHIPIWESLLRKPVHYIPSWVDLEKFRPVEHVPDRDIIRIGMMDFWRITREPFGLFMAIDQLRQMTKKKVVVNVWGLLEQPSKTWKAVIQWLVEDGVVILRGNTQDPMKDIYSQNDMILTMSTEETRVLREAYACGVPVICGRHCPDITDFSADGLYPVELARQILNCHQKLCSRAACFGGNALRRKLRAYAEHHFDIKPAVASVAEIFRNVLSKHGSVRSPRDPVTGGVPRVQPVLQTATTIRDRVVKQTPFTYVRFGDGDLILMGGLGEDSFHRSGEQLQSELKEAFLIDDPNYLIGCSAGQINEGKMRKGLFARFDYNTKLQAVVDQLRPKQNFHNAVALSYQFVFDPQWFIDFLEVLRGRNTLFIGGASVVDHDLIQAIFGKDGYALPDRDAYYALDQPAKQGTVYDNIKAKVARYDVVVCAAGMATRVLAKRLWKDGVRTTFIDIGSVVDALAGLGNRTWIQMVDPKLIKKYAAVFMNRNTDIVVLTHGQQEVTKTCFEAIKQHTDNYRVLWVDNGSPPADLAAIRESAATLRSCDLIQSDINLGFSRAVNLALRKIFYQGTSNYIALVNNDVVVTPDWLDHLITAMETNGLSAVGPLTSEGNPHAVEAVRQVVPELPVFKTTDVGERAALLWSQFGSKAVESGNMMSFFCCVLRRDVVEQIGLLDEHFFAYGEDNDYFERMKRLRLHFGIALGCYVHHNHHATSAGFGDAWIQERKQEAVQRLKQKYG